MQSLLCNFRLHYWHFFFYKITNIVRALWLAERCHGCDVNLFAFPRANHARTNLKKLLSLKARHVYFIYPFPSRLKLGKSIKNMLCQFFFAWADKTRILESTFFAKQRLIARTSFVCKTSRLVRISLLINALNKSVLLFLLGKLFFWKQ